MTNSPRVLNAKRGLALAAFVLVAALQPAAHSSAAFLPIEHHSVVTLSRFGGAVLFGVAACFVSFRTLAVLSAAGCGLAFLAFALTNLSTLAWLSLPLIAFGGALQVASYMLVLNSIESSSRYERTWWLLKDALVWVALLFGSSLSLAFLRGGGFFSCALLVAIALFQAEAASPAPHVGRGPSLLLLGAGCAVSLALSVLAFSINKSLAGTGAGLFLVGSILGELLLLNAVGLSASVLPKPVSTWPLVGWILVGAAPLLPLATLVDVPALAAVSGASNGSVATASSLLLLAFLRPLPQRLQPLASASWLCIAPLIEGAVERCGDSFGPPASPRIVLSLAAVTLAAGLALLRASRVEGDALSGAPSGR